MHAVDIYGLSEVMGPGVANECVETKDGLHVWEDHFYPEVIDPETGAVLPEGERGELVFTSLTKEAMPVIRYRTRDLTRLLPGTARSMRRIEKITGRSDDMMIVRGVNVFPTQIEELILQRRAARAAFRHRAAARGAARRDDREGRGAPRRRRCDARGLQQRSCASDQGADRRHRDGGDDRRPARSSARSARRSGSWICGGRADLSAHSRVSGNPVLGRSTGSPLFAGTSGQSTSLRMLDQLPPLPGDASCARAS